MAQSVVLLHGFSGTHRAWDGVIAALDAQRYTPLAPDLPGHGGAGASREQDIGFDGCVRHVLEQAPERFQLCGYSMGARIALMAALASPQRVSRLVLVGANPGIEDERERAQRRERDHLLAQELERQPFEEFIERWRAQPLFAGEPPQAGRLAREDQRRNNPVELAAALRRLGTGEMPPLWGRLGELAMPVTLVAGARDQKFVAIAERMAPLIGHAEVALLEGGHGLPLENPRALAAVIEGRSQRRDAEGR